MRHHTLQRAAAAAIAIALLPLGLVGCAKAGADTTCKDFLGMSADDQKAQVSKLYKDKHDRDPSGLELSGLQTEASVWCNTAGHADSKIKEIPIS
ncbi:hypothetical protein P0W64_09035 [Tsukamurella sp. 8F]|uniref:hypothetical protein n=1 Tax=unclassified Tsukamurella TaxID=2633480 RepID=UPI0023B991FC|nr:MULTISPECIES: hypothetical protein [unclassified Tsukamurella]MDF0532409.1 hypothetical protein [Tsukamurella sp. 8J]MDF0586915.1 hypothetical protein [Tsukamurella sp. 8F]